jgi:hypothetical protein
MKRRLILSASVLALGTIAVFPAVASASPTSGIEHVQITAVNGNPGAVLARGVFTASGINYQKSKSSGLFVFSTGAFTVHHPGGTGSFSVNPKTCLFKGTSTGSYTINGGVGVYQGITGSGTYVSRESGVLPRNPNGTCDESNSAQPFSSVEQISASGPVSFKE